MRPSSADAVIVTFMRRIPLTLRALVLVPLLAVLVDSARATLACGPQAQTCLEAAGRGWLGAAGLALLGIDRAFFWIAGLIILIAVVIWMGRRVISQSAPAAPDETARKGVVAVFREAISSPWALFGGLAIFLYVGAEVAIGTQMAFFLNSDRVWGVPLEDAAKYVSLYWGGAMVGRLIGSGLLTQFAAPKLLAVFTGMAAAMCFYVFAVGGVSAGYIALAIGLFNSIMFPVIFTITLERSTASEEATSGFLCFSIIGGAAIPPLVGLVSQNSDYVFAFIVPAICYAILLFFAMSAGRARVAHRAPEPPVEPL